MKDICIDDVLVSYHALDRFVERLNPNNVGKDPEATLRKMFVRAKEIKYINPRHNFRRLLNNGCRDARYFRHESGLIFVYVEDFNTLVTVEPAIRKKENVDFVFVETHYSTLHTH